MSASAPRRPWRTAEASIRAAAGLASIHLEGNVDLAKQITSLLRLALEQVGDPPAAAPPTLSDRLAQFDERLDERLAVVTVPALRPVGKASRSRRSRQDRFISALVKGLEELEDLGDSVGDGGELSGERSDNGAEVEAVGRDRVRQQADVVDDAFHLGTSLGDVEFSGHSHTPESSVAPGSLIDSAARASVAPEVAPEGTAGPRHIPEPTSAPVVSVAPPYVPVDDVARVDQVAPAQVEFDPAAAAANVRAEAARRGLDQAQLGALLGLSASTISDRNRGRTEYRLSDLRSLADAWGIPLEVLLAPVPAAAPRRPPVAVAFDTADAAIEPIDGGVRS